MPMTRARASALLNQREMALYDDSRANALRQLDDRALQQRINRARNLRDRARDLHQRQALQARQASTGKRGADGNAHARTAGKAELLADILQRFEAHHARLGSQQPTTPLAGDTATARTATPRVRRVVTTGQPDRAAGARRAGAATRTPAAGDPDGIARRTAPRVRHTTAVDVQEAETGKVARASRGAASKASRQDAVPAPRPAVRKTGVKKAAQRADRSAAGGNAAGVQASRGALAQQATAPREASKAPPGPRDSSRTGPLSKGSRTVRRPRSAG